MIEVRELVWDKQNVSHIWERHQLTPEQVEEACHANPEHILVEQTYGSRLRIIAPRLNGKLLVVILAPQGEGSYYVVTAKPPKRQELRRYTEWKAGKQS
jgi:uncharacterized DUF497 family protein